MIRSIVFFVALFLPILLWGITDGLILVGADDRASQIVEAIVAVTPILTNDLSVVGEVTPAALSAMLIVGAPQVGANKPRVSLLAILVLVTGYIAMLRMSWGIESPDFTTILHMSFTEDAQRTAALESLRSVIESVRTFTIVAAVGITAFFVKRSTS